MSRSAFPLLLALGDAASAKSTWESGGLLPKDPGRLPHDPHTSWSRRAVRRAEVRGRSSALGSVPHPTRQSALKVIRLRSAALTEELPLVLA